MINVGVVGLGLIGGSLGQALKRIRRNGKPVFYVVGLSRKKSTVLQARRMKAIDTGSDHPSILSNADIVVLAVPVQSMAPITRKIRPALKKGAILTDVGSVKSNVLKEVRRALGSRRDVSFVGAHPIAGSEKAGLIYSHSNLFKNSICVLTTDGAKPNAVRRVSKLWSSVGAKTIPLNAKNHDRFLAVTSHLPHVLAFALFSEVFGLSQSNSAVKSLVAGSFRDMTRIAASSPDVWAGILESNSAEIKSAWTIFDRQVRRLLSSKGGALRSRLARLSSARKKWTLS
jgi:prephenate dehydrogenase